MVRLLSVLICSVCAATTPASALLQFVIETFIIYKPISHPSVMPVSTIYQDSSAISAFWSAVMQIARQAGMSRRSAYQQQQQPACKVTIRVYQYVSHSLPFLLGLFA